MSPLLLPAITLVLALGLFPFLKRKRARLRRKRERRARKAFWSIGCMESDSPLRWTPSEATVLRPKTVAPDMFIIADPFLFEDQGERYLFFEAMRDEAPAAHIECARFDHAQQSWTLLGPVLTEPFHLSYPQVIRDGDQIYMIPESKQARRVGLYRAVDFPTQWEFVKPLIEGRKLVDSSLIKVDDHWYCFTSRKKQLFLYVSARIDGPWRPHPGNPVRRGNFSRCGGRILQHEGKHYRLAQDQRGYGAGLHAFEIITLTPTRYKEVPAKTFNPILLPGSADWAETGMHHLDVIQIAPDRYFGVFDGEQFDTQQ
jgi:hypothetical protein